MVAGRLLAGELFWGDGAKITSLFCLRSLRPSVMAIIGLRKLFLRHPKWRRASALLMLRNE
jgi:hypothetical protein